MTERAAIAQVLQLAKETTSGTAMTTGFKKLQSVGFSVHPMLETRLVRPAGSKYPTIAILGRDWSQLSIAGDAAYQDLQYLFQSVVGNVVNTTNNHKYHLSTTGPDVVNTLTVQRGEDAGRFEEAAGVQVNDLSLAFSRQAVSVSGAALGKATRFGTGGVAAGGTVLALEPLLPQDVCVYFDPSFAALGTTKELRTLSATWSIANRFNPLWVLDCAESSYVALVEATPDVRCELLVEADTQGVAFVDTYARAGANGFLRIEADGGTIGGSAYLLSIDTSVTVVSVGELGDSDGVYAFSIQMEGVIAPWATAAPGICQINLDNGIAAL